MKLTMRPSGAGAYRLLAMILAAAATATGCPATARFEAWAPTSALGGDMDAFRPPRAPTSGDGKVRLQEPTGTLTLPEALAAALMGNPALRAVAWEVRAREAERIQAGLLPNPGLEVTAEDFGATGRLRGAREMELTFAVSQVIWLGGQRARRTRLAAIRSREAGWRFERERLAVLTRTAQSFVAVVAAQRRVALAAKQEALLERIARLFRERSEAGKIARQDLGRTRVEIQLERSRLQRARLRRRLAVARQHLAARWGGIRARFQRAGGRLEGRASLPDRDALLARIRQSPQVRAWQARLAHRRAAVALSEAGAVPDLTVTGGVRLLPQDRSVGFVAGLSLPLPVFDRNQGATLAARLRVSAARERLRAARVEVARRLVRAHQEASAAEETVRRLKASILPRSREAVAAALEAYRQGKADHLAVLDAQRTLVALEAERVEAMARLLSRVAELERLLGEPLHRAPASGDRRPPRGTGGPRS